MTWQPGLVAEGPWLPCLGVAANVTASRGYVLATARGQVRPSCASWFALALIPGLALGAAVAVGARVGAITAAAAGVVPAAVLVAAAAAARRGRRAAVETSGVQGHLDAAVLGGCVGAVLVWALTDNPLVVLVDSVLIGLLATAPTLVRAWRGHERAGPFLGRVAAATCALPVVPQWTVLADWMYAAYQLGTGVLLCVVIVARRRPGAHALSPSRPAAIPAAVLLARHRPTPRTAAPLPLDRARRRIGEQALNRPEHGTTGPS